MTISKIDVGEFVRSVANGHTVHWIPNPGNAGDALIAAGTEQVFRRSGIDFRAVEDANRFESAGAVVCYGGGGNLVPNYAVARRTLIRHHEHAARLILLPHTVSGHEDLLASFGANVAIICREARSYEHCRNSASRAEVLAADDLAFSVTRSLPVRLAMARSAAAAGAVYEDTRRKHVEFLLHEGWRRELDVFRDDSERNVANTYAPGNDLSRLLRPQGQRLVEMLISAHFLMATIDGFDSIRTDRLHVAIAGALLGKRVKLYANSYYKNRAVYEFSLRSFPNVEFIDV